MKVILVINNLTKEVGQGGEEEKETTDVGREETKMFPERHRMMVIPVWLLHRVLWKMAGHQPALEILWMYF